MDRELVRQAEPVEEILTFDIADDTLGTGCQRRTQRPHLDTLYPPSV